MCYKLAQGRAGRDVTFRIIGPDRARQNRLPRTSPDQHDSAAAQFRRDPNPRLESTVRYGGMHCGAEKAWSTRSVPFW